MHCHEFHEVMRSFIDGEVDGKTRREVARHLVACHDCAQLIEDDSYWDKTILSYLDHEVPEGLRDSILGDLAHVQIDGASLNDLGWRQQLGIAWWAIRRDLSRPRGMLQVATVSVVLILAVIYLPLFQSNQKSTGTDEPFRHSGPIVQMDQPVDWNPGETVPTTRLSLAGQLI